jgi:large subunit ribosomal protein L29
MKAAKWRELSDDEVRQKARELSEEIFNLRFQLSMGVAKNPSSIGRSRRDLARAHTMLRERGVPGVGALTPVSEPRAETPAPKKPRAKASKAARPKAKAADSKTKARPKAKTAKAKS